MPGLGPRGHARWACSTRSRSARRRTVMALRGANRALAFPRLSALALGVGRDHLTATLNTLVLAYVGASLPIRLLFSAADLGVGNAFNLEVVEGGGRDARRLHRAD